MKYLFYSVVVVCITWFAVSQTGALLDILGGLGAGILLLLLLVMI